MFDSLVVIRGGGDLATGVIQKFYRSGFPLLVLETARPTAIRRNVALCEAVYTGEAEVEGMRCRLISDITAIPQCHKAGVIPMMVDPGGEVVSVLRPHAVIDAILAKRNLGTHQSMAPVTIALGPGFCAGEEVHAVIETMRGHQLGRLILSGAALPNTGIPGEIGGKSAQRVIHAPCAGEVRHRRQIGDAVKEGEILFTVAQEAVHAPFSGLLRGLIREGLHVPKGMKVADIDPRMDVDWHTISDKARCLGGAALEAYLFLSAKQKREASV